MNPASALYILVEISTAIFGNKKIKLVYKILFSIYLLAALTVGFMFIQALFNHH